MRNYKVGTLSLREASGLRDGIDTLSLALQSVRMRKGSIRNGNGRRMTRNDHRFKYRKGEQVYASQTIANTTIPSLPLSRKVLLGTMVRFYNICLLDSILGN